MLVPKLFTTLGSYSRRQFTADLIAGVLARETDHGERRKVPRDERRS